MELAELKQAVPGLADKSHYDKVKIFGWWLHVHKSQATFTGADIAKCYDALHFSKPSSFGGYIGQLADKKELPKNGSGYRLENKIREQFDAAYATPAERSRSRRCSPISPPQFRTWRSVPTIRKR